MNNKSCSIDKGLLTAGQALVKQRQKLGLAPVDCAESLKITEGKLEALESGEKSKFTSELFVRGYLKNYAKLVNITEEEILHLYHIKEQPDHTINAEIEEARNIPKRSIWWLPYFVVASIVTAWFFASDYFYKGVPVPSDIQHASNVSLLGVGDLAAPVLDDGGDASRQSDMGMVDSSLSFSGNESPLSLVSLTGESNEVLPVRYVLAPQLDSTQGIITAESVVINTPFSVSSSEGGATVNELTAVELVGKSLLDSKAPLNTAVASVKDTVKSEEPLVQTVVASRLAVTEFDVLYLSFVQECWVKITDASGEILVSSLRMRNTRLEVKGEAPFGIILGNVVGTSMLFNGEAVALNSDSPSRTLHLTVGD